MYKLLKDQDPVIADSLLVTWCSYQAPFCWSGSGVYEVVCVPEHWHLIFQGVVAMRLAFRAVILGNLVEGKIRGIRLQHLLCTVEGKITEGPLTLQGLLKSLHKV